MIEIRHELPADRESIRELNPEAFIALRDAAIRTRGFCNVAGVSDYRSYPVGVAITQ